MEDVHQRAKRDLPKLRQSVDGLLALANEMVENVPYSESDHLAFMALCFLSKQIDHTRSVLALIPSRDVVLIARSMIEGLCQLLWAAEDPDRLPLQWRAFAWVHDWRVMQTKNAAGEPVDPKRRAGIESALRLYGDQFLTTKAKIARDNSTPLPADPYHKVTVHVGKPKSSCPTWLRVVRSEVHGHSRPLATRDMGAHTARGPGADCGAGCGARATAGRLGQVASHGGGVGPAAGEQLAQLLPAALGGSASDDDTAAPQA
jgi:hypothetical protein